MNLGSAQSCFARAPVACLWGRGGCRLWALLAALIAIWPHHARAFDLFAKHEVTVQLATPDGKPMANADVRVFAPGRRDRPALTGRTDKDGKFVFPADEDGMWTAEARAGGEVARVAVRVGGTARPETGGPLSPYWVFGLLGLLLVAAFAFRILRARRRARRAAIDKPQG